MHNLLRCVLLVSSTSVFAAQIDISIEAIPPRMHDQNNLSVIKTKKHLPSLRLRVDNKSDAAITLIRPRTRMLDMFEQWGGWQMNISSAQGRCWPAVMPGMIPPVTGNDKIELQPGKGFNVDLELDNWCWWTPGTKTIPNDVASGQYRVQIDYKVPKIYDAERQDFMVLSALNETPSAALDLLLP